MIHEILPVGWLQCNCSILGDETTGEAMVIDPGDDIEAILEIVARHRLKVKAIIITHAHIDHIGGAKKMKAATGAPVYLNENDRALYQNLGEQAKMIGTAEPEKTSIDLSPKDGDTIQAGGIKASVIHTPGHTPGSICLYSADRRLVIVGDMLQRMRGAVTYPNYVFTDDMGLARRSIARLAELDIETILFSHYPALREGGRDALRTLAS